MKTCSVDSCGKKVHAKGFCQYHYGVFNRLGTPFSKRPTFHGTPEERLKKYTKKNEKTGCIEWVGNKDKDGYGQMRADGKMKRPHRVAYELYVGAIPKGLFVLHKCNNPACCNPKHLYVGNHKRNMLDRLKSGNYPTGEKHPNCKFNDSVVAQIKLLDGPAHVIGSLYGMSASQVRNIRLGKQRCGGLL